MWECAGKTHPGGRLPVNVRNDAVLQGSGAAPATTEPYMSVSVCVRVWFSRWQYTGRAGFPPAPSQLSGYGVKDRLSSRWQEVHQVGA